MPLSRLYISSLLLMTFAGSCDIINPDEEPVSYIYIEDMPLEVRPNEGAASENIVDVWVNVDGTLIGGFEMPVTVPILREGPVNVKLTAGILDNGLSSTHRRYPFYQFYEENVELIRDGVLTMEPVATYIENNVVLITEDFEDPGFTMDETETSDTTLIRIDNPDPSDLLRGNSVGAIFLDEEHLSFSVETQVELEIANKNIAYLEIDYKTDGPIVVGIRRNDSPTTSLSLVGLNPKRDSDGDIIWNKAYVNLADALDVLQISSSYEIFVTGATTGEDRTYLIDNIKVVYPEI